MHAIAASLVIASAALAQPCEPTFSDVVEIKEWQGSTGQALDRERELIYQTHNGNAPGEVGLTIFDVSDPTEMSIVHQVEIPTSFCDVKDEHFAWRYIDIAVTSEYAYIIGSLIRCMDDEPASALGGLWWLDVTDPSSPKTKIVGVDPISGTSYSTWGLPSEPTVVRTSGDYVWAAYSSLFVENDGIDILRPGADGLLEFVQRIDLQEAPVDLRIGSEVALAATAGPNGSSHLVKIPLSGGLPAGDPQYSPPGWGQHAFDLLTDSIIIRESGISIDISDIANPVVLDAVPNPPSHLPSHRTGNDIVVRGDLAFESSGNFQQIMHVYHVGDPHNLSLLSTFGQRGAQEGGASRIDVVNGHAILSGEVNGSGVGTVPGQEGLFSLNIQNCVTTADFDGSSTVDSHDLSVLLAAWGSPAADLDGDGVTGSSDLAILVAAWGPVHSP